MANIFNQSIQIVASRTVLTGISGILCSWPGVRVETGGYLKTYPAKLLNAGA